MSSHTRGQGHDHPHDDSTHCGRRQNNDADPSTHNLHNHSLPPFQHHERRTYWVIGLAFITMVVELICGYLTHSLALIADGWHMATHVGALGVSALAYWFARTRAKHSTFSFGTGKVFALSGYSSAVVLLLMSLLMMVSAIERMFEPVHVAYDQALLVSGVGLAVNLLSAWLLNASHEGHDHDLNMKAAYLHVIADALTSLLAIFALLGGKYAGLYWLDPVMALLGGLLVGRWGIGLCRTTGAQLLDAAPSMELANDIRQRIEALGDERVVDLHLWELGPGRKGCIVSIVTGAPRPLADYRAAVLSVTAIDHLTVEIDRQLH